MFLTLFLLAHVIPFVLGKIDSETLVGIHIQAENFDRVQFENVLKQLKEMVNKDSLENIFACVTNLDSLIIDPVIHKALVESEVPHFYGSNKYSGILCSFEHPEIEKYSYILEVDSGADLSDKVFGLSLPTLERDLSVVYMDTKHKSAVEEILAQSDGSFFGVVTAMKTVLSKPPNPASTDENSVVVEVLTNSSHYNMPQRAATSKYHSSGPCNLWWPLDGAEILVYASGHPNLPRLHKEPMIVICPKFKEFVTMSTHGNAAKRRGLKKIVSLEVFHPGPDDVYPHTQPRATTSGMLSAEGVDWEEAIQIMNTIEVPPNCSHIRLRMSMCNIDPQVTQFDRSACFISFDVVVRVVWGDNVPLVKSSSALHPMAATMDSRDLFGHALKMMNHNSGTFVEVGVNRGHYAKLMLTQWGGSRYLMVDPWAPAPSEEYVDAANADSMEAHNAVLKEAIGNVKSFGGRPAVIRDTSVGAARLLVNNTVDVVYVDGLHHYQGVMDDIEAWWPKLKRGGVMAGHDYYLMAEASTIFTVKPAVDEFARKMGLVVFQTHDSYPTWFVFKE